MPQEPKKKSLVQRALGFAWRHARRLPGAQPLRYWLELRFQKRDYYSFTQFLRLPTQYQALVGPVLSHFGAANRSAPLRIVVIGCSTGAEPYSISSVLQARRPELAFEIDACDIAEPLLEKARLAEYSEKDVLGNKLIPTRFLEETFEITQDRYIVRRKVAERVVFHHGDVLAADFPDTVPAADIVYAQYILFNFPRPTARRALKNICRLLKPKAALFLAGTDLDLRAASMHANGLRPLDYEIERIHDEARVVRGPRWPRSYTGLEPFNRRRRDWKTHYATVFLRGDSQEPASILEP